MVHDNMSTGAYETIPSLVSFGEEGSTRFGEEGGTLVGLWNGLLAGNNKRRRTGF